ncbi:MAG TPA: hypothetical protein VJT73_09595 [Polyangiaceae bacterium]|nr:hypothetical protein [Polyangiaceae bacterium]
MKRLVTMVLGMAVAVPVTIAACGGSDSNSTPPNGTTGTAGSSATGSGGSSTGSGSAGSTTSGTGGSAGSGAGGSGGSDFNFDAGSLRDVNFNFDAIFGSYTCADLATCCAKLAGQAQTQCSTIVGLMSQPVCSGALTAYKAGGQCN